MVYIYICLLMAYYHLKLDVIKENLLAAGFSAVPAVFLVLYKYSGHVCRIHGKSKWMKNPVQRLRSLRNMGCKSLPISAPVMGFPKP